MRETEYFSDMYNKYPRLYTDIRKLDVNWYIATVHLEVKDEQKIFE